MKGFSKLGWAALALLGAFCLGTVALRRGEHINALWIVVAAVCACAAELAPIMHTPGAIAPAAPSAPRKPRRLTPSAFFACIGQPVGAAPSSSC